MRIPIESACWRALACSEAHASYHASASGPLYCLAEYIGFATVVMTELELREIERQILLRDVVISANNSAFEQRPERLDIVRVNLATHILACIMGDDFVRKAKPQIPITAASSVAIRLTRSATAFRTNPLSVCSLVSSITLQTTFPLRAIAPMTAVLPVLAAPRPLYRARRSHGDSSAFRR